MAGGSDLTKIFALIFMLLAVIDYYAIGFPDRYRSMFRLKLQKLTIRALGFV